MTGAPAAAGTGRGPAGLDPSLAAACCVLIGAGAVLLLPGLLGGRSAALAAGVLLAAAGLFALLVAGWLDDLGVAILALPLPTAWSGGSVRISAPLLMTTVVVAAWLLRRPARGRPLAAGRLPVAAGLAVVGWMAVTTLFAPDRGAAVREMANVAVLAAFLLAATDALARRPVRRQRVAVTLAVVAACTGVAAILESLGALPAPFPLFGTSLYRAAGGFGQPNGLAMFLALSLPFAVHARAAAGSTVGRLLGTVGIAAVAGGLLATFSRGSWAAAILAPVALVLAGSTRAVVRVWAIAAVGAVAVDLGSGGVLSDRVLAVLEDPSALQRLALMAAGGLMALDQPWVGVGPGGFGAALDEYGMLVPGLWDFVPSAHNTAVHMAAETGFVGLALLGAFVALAGVRLLGRARAGAAAAPPSPDALLDRTVLWCFATALVLGMFEWLLVHGPVQVILVALALGLSERAPRPGAGEGGAP